MMFVKNMLILQHCFAMLDLETADNDIPQRSMHLYVSISCICYTVSSVVHQYTVTLKAASEK